MKKEVDCLKRMTPEEIAEKLPCANIRCYKAATYNAIIYSGSMGLVISFCFRCANRFSRINQVYKEPLEQKHPLSELETKMLNTVNYIRTLGRSVSLEELRIQLQDPEQSKVCHRLRDLGLLEYDTKIDKWRTMRNENGNI